jgi:3-oxoacyl-[acyl-carrier protein] reductase
MHLNGRVAVVTGASRGIGRAIALRLARDGAAVAINYRSSTAEAESALEQIRQAGGVSMAVRADIAAVEQVQQMAQEVRTKLGAVDILVNNAGVMMRGDLEDFDFSQMQGMRSTNVDGLVSVTRAFAPAMKERGWGRIINLTSIAAHGTSMAGTTFYAATKAAVGILTRRFAMDLGPHGVTVNGIAPGFIMTDMVHQGRSPEEVEQTRSSISAKAMMRRVGTPEDIAAAVAFLASEEASFITAQILTVDGGRMDYLTHS